MTTAAQIKTNNAPIRTTVNARMIVAASITQAINDVRYYLNGIRIQPCPTGGATVVSTDGHRMFVATDKSGSTSESIIIRLSKPFLSMAAKHAKTNENATIEIIGKLALLNTSDEPIDTNDIATGNINPETTPAIGAVDLIEGQFPAWERLIPSSIEIANLKESMNTTYLSDLEKIGKILLNKKTVTVSASTIPNTNPSCVFYQFDSDQYKSLVMVMPCRSETTERKLPEHIIALKEAYDAKQRT